MKLILLENIKSLGVKGDIKEVTDGYAINFLLPQKKAALATAHNLVKQKNNIDEGTKKVQEQKSNYQKILKVLNNSTISFKVKVSEKEHLFQGIHIKDIIEYIENNFNLDLNEKWFKGNISLKTLGRFPIFLNLPDGNKVTIFIEIKSE
tara:strand:+ start:123 stop:569 length:447 start_codon:yes stop_codon:yes gene_type:complete